MNMLPYSGIPALPKNIEDMHAQLVALGLNDVEALTARIKKCEDWVDAVEETEFTGNPVVFQNALAVPAASLEANIEPIQDLHGYDHPWAGGAGKNLLPMTVANLKALNTSGTWTENNYETNGVTFAVQTDSDGNVTGIKTTGTASGNANFDLVRNFDVSSCFLSGCPSGSNGNNYYIRCGIGGTYYTDSGSGVAINGTITSVWIGVANTNSAPSGIWYPQIESGSSATTFAPYTNICPISGRTETSVTTTNEDESESSSVTIQLGQTVYGGQVDFKTGVVRVTDAIVSDMGALGWLRDTSEYAYAYFYVNISGRKIGNNSPLISSIFKSGTQRSALNDNEIAPYNLSTSNAIAVRADQYTDVTSFKTAVTGQTVCYKLATPTELTLTPAQLQMLKGYNSVSSDDASSLTVTAYTGGPWEPITRAIKKVTNKTKTTKKRRK